MCVLARPARRCGCYSGFSRPSRHRPVHHPAHRPVYHPAHRPDTPPSRVVVAVDTSQAAEEMLGNLLRVFELSENMRGTHPCAIQRRPNRFRRDGAFF